ncbi:uncharacterized protein LOC119733354 isoform X2 [Patiria miniata]|uniref:Uncharacterized protein n=1 Tax=Patiria miniata TaxID=46514 RepID=A0A914AHL2_PATMI|nr:uncharacterized protein LOC119733354 isoform X2 [Patiria miniata]
MLRVMRWCIDHRRSAEKSRESIPHSFLLLSSHHFDKMKIVVLLVCLDVAFAQHGHEFDRDATRSRRKVLANHDHDQQTHQEYLIHRKFGRDATSAGTRLEDTHARKQLPERPVRRKIGSIAHMKEALPPGFYEAYEPDHDRQGYTKPKNNHEYGPGAISIQDAVSGSEEVPSPKRYGYNIPDRHSSYGPGAIGSHDESHCETPSRHKGLPGRGGADQTHEQVYDNRDREE